MKHDKAKAKPMSAEQKARGIDRIHETLKTGGTIDAADAVIYAQHHIKQAEAAAYERAAQVADDYAKQRTRGWPEMDYFETVISTADDIATAIRALKTEGT